MDHNCGSVFKAVLPQRECNKGQWKKDRTEMVLSWRSGGKFKVI